MLVDFKQRQHQIFQDLSCPNSEFSNIKPTLRFAPMRTSKIVASRSPCERWPNPVRDLGGQHDNAVRLSFRLTRGAARAGCQTPLRHNPATVRRRKWIMPRDLVRVVGLEPTLLAERDFESDETTHNYRRNWPAEISMLSVVLINNGHPPFFERKCVSTCAIEGEAYAPHCATLSSPAAKWRQSL
jgi:hypothetical protein